MDVSDLIDSLNDVQRQAVSAPPGHLLVQAGAGSGKTRVLVHRIAWLNRVEGISPFGIMAVTFTNKAAREMRLRVEQLLGQPVGPMWIGTFHGIAHRFLRMHWQEAKLPQAFQILDSDDQLRVVKRVIRTLELDETLFPPRQVQWFINGHKDEGRRPAHIDDENDPITAQYIRVYTAYEAACKRAGAVDFAELLLRALETLRDTPALLAHYRKRLQHLLIDEFQDTNAIQYAWIRLLAGDTGHVFAVGDDDQSIYAWRGARVENILNFDQDFPGAELIRLEQNYRSTSNILNAANALIDKNQGRLGKNLWTEGGAGELITLYNAYNETDEARFIVETIVDRIADGAMRRDCAILYRSNAQSRVIEEYLVAAGVSYRVYGGLRFFERSEIKDTLAYLRLATHSYDDVSLERIINQPARGIGDKTVGEIRNEARARNIPLWEAANELVNAKRLSGRANTAVAKFLSLIESMREAIIEQSLPQQVQTVSELSGLIEHFKKDTSDRGQSRVENVEELSNAARTFAHHNDDEPEMNAIDEFLAHAALEAGEGQAEADDNAVQLMTLHSAKGLEFPVVFMAGMEQGLFPHQRSAEDPVRMEEERRLCYVGITRAERKLYMCMAEQRRLHGRDQYNPPSKFIAELPAELLEEIRPRMQVSTPVYRPKPSTRFVEEANDTGLSVGQMVKHGKFGVGVVLDQEGRGKQARVQVNFEEAGSKWLVLAYANLQPV
ncbi:DNA helicase II [Granulosicoccus antarcticus]|uniref:DNA 3'-5' helicase n=1 Tax=Granulosicoccus antarcticus IMCC3135 TaxID=1192854 RepID=A0A2Z2NFX9_9GAMM|nr:DNA helicase II [Granulosicoccus antarcticus]ASJ70159.1 DNA helicase II [Granulosicoccus antarcticus IMCC3135]